MSIPLTGQVAHKTHVDTEAGLEGLSTLDKCVLLVLADGERRAGGAFAVGYERLAAWCRATKRGVMQSVQRLERWGVLSISGDKKGGAGRRNGYRVVAADLVSHYTRKKGEVSAPLKGEVSSPKRVKSVHHVPSTSPKAIVTTEAGSSLPFPKLVEAGTSSHLVTDHTESDGKAKAKADKHEEKQRQKALLSELAAILRGVDVEFGLLTPRDILEAWQAKGERMAPSLLPAAVRKIIRVTLWRRVREPAAYLVGRVKEEARLALLQIPVADLHARRLH